MKKLILTLLIITGISINSYSQTWNEIYSNDQVIVETTISECNLYNNKYPNSFLLVKYTNKTNQIIKFEFEFDLWYNDVYQEHVGDISSIKNITLSPNEVREGYCKLNSDTYKIFYKHNHPKMDQQLTKITLKEHKTK